MENMEIVVEHIYNGSKPSQNKTRTHTENRGKVKREEQNGQRSSKRRTRARKDDKKQQKGGHRWR